VPDEKAVTAAPTAPLPATPVRDWSRLLARAAVAVWWTGALAFASLQLVRILAMSRRLRRHAEPADADLSRRVAELSSRLGLRGTVDVRIVSAVASPLVFSIFRPRLLWPAALPAAMPDDARDGLILHELAHVKRGDHLVGWLELLAGCLWWWNPLFWYVRHELRESAELACDAWVVQALPPRRGRRAYAEGLLAVCETLCHSRPEPPMPAVGVNTGGRRFLERRLAMIFRETLPPLRLGRASWLSLVVLALAALPAWSQQKTATVKEGAPEATGPVQFTTTEVDPAAAAAGEGAPVRIRLFRTSAAIATPDAALPAGARELIEQYETQKQQARAEYEKKVADQRAALIEGLQKVQDQYTRSGQLDEAVAVRDRIRQLQRDGNAGGGPGDRVINRIRGAYASPSRRDPGNLESYRERVNQSFDFLVTGSTDGTVWGTGTYTDDSRLAAAAVHAGILTDGQTGMVRVTILPGRTSYDGSTRNGVTSLDYRDWGGSFRFEPPLHAYRPVPPGATEGSFLSQFRDHVGAIVLREVTGSTQGTVWGSGVYTDDSSIEAAAVHAGVLRDGEKGMVKITILPGQDSYQGCSQNGVTSSSYGPWAGSFRIERAEASGPGPGSGVLNYGEVFSTPAPAKAP
jgi:beta-lactamase regulating signal transducer with metallopeptidase domain